MPPISWASQRVKSKSGRGCLRVAFCTVAFSVGEFLVGWWVCNVLREWLVVFTQSIYRSIASDPSNKSETSLRSILEKVADPSCVSS